MKKNLTTLPVNNVNDVFIGREDELDLLKEKLHVSNKIVLLNGIGGVGKTALASAYLQQFRNDYTNVVWVEQTTTIIQAFTGKYELVKNLDIPEKFHLKESSELFAEIMRKLRNYKSDDLPNLLIIDNVEDALKDNNIYKLLPQSPDWHVLITSQHKNASFENFELGFLNEVDSMELFYEYYKRKRNDEVLKTILENVGYHTLTIEILAKTAQRRRLKISELKKSIQKDIKTGTIQIAHDKEHQINTITGYLEKIFGLSKIGKEDKKLLMKMAALPPEFIGYDILEQLLKTNDDFPDILETVHEKGWLIKDKINDRYKIHNIVKEIILNKLNPGYLELKPLIDKITALLKIDQNRDNPVDKFKWIPFAESVSNIFPNDTNPSIAICNNRLAVILYSKGEYNKAKDIFEKVLEADIKNYGINDSSVATSQSNLATIYNQLGENDKARELLEQALKTVEENLEDNHPKIAVAQSNLANIFIDIGEYEKARDLLEKALRSDQINYKENHPRIAISQSNLASVYKDLGEYEKSRDLLILALESAEKNFEKKHPKVAVRQSNLANVYLNMGEYDKALGLLKEALESDLENFGEFHPSVATRYNNLYYVYKQKNDMINAKNAILKAYNIAVKVWGQHHPSTKIIKESIEDFN